MSRIHRLIWGMAAAGTLAAGWKFGWRGALGFLVGSAVSAWNYGRLEAIADAITRQYVAAPPQAEAPPVPRRSVRSIVLLVLRYATAAAALYVIVKYFEVNLMAALAGLFVGFAAVFIDALITQVRGAGNASP